jgi:hemerythrin
MTLYPDPLLAPDQITLVALESMNRIHREEVELVNRLAALVANGMQGEIDETSITAQLGAWVEHTRAHFTHENELMKQYGFPAFSIHSGEHQRVLNLLQDLQQGWLRHQALQPLAEFLFDQWPAWLDNHLLTMDSVTADYVRLQGG